MGYFVELGLLQTGNRYQKVEYKVAFVLHERKANRYFNKGLEKEAAKQGVYLIEFVADQLHDLSVLEGADVVVHKVDPFSAIARRLHEYCVKHEVRLVSGFDKIERVCRRDNMLDPVRQGINIKHPYQNHTLEVRTLLEFVMQKGAERSTTLSALRQSGLKYPLMIKPLGSTYNIEENHEVLVVYREEGLTELARKKDYVVQQFVEHEIMYKLYIIGSQICVQRRQSVRVNMEDMTEQPNYQKLGRISCFNRKSDCQGNTEMPPSDILYPCLLALSQKLRRLYELQLFNVDLVIPEQQDPGKTLVYIIDVNYFPGVNKCSQYEKRLAQFFKEVGDEYCSCTSNISVPTRQLSAQGLAA